MHSLNLAVKYKQDNLEKLQDEVLQDFKKLCTATSLRKATEDMMMAILGADRLGAKSEVEVCEMLLTWLEVHTQAGHTVQPHKQLMLIRWSGISAEYVITKLLQNRIPSSDPESVNFLSKVKTYLLSGVQFEGLRTFHRPSTGVDNCLITFSLSTGDHKDISKEITCISLQRPGTVTKLTKLPDSMNQYSEACVLDDTVYITGAGRDPYKELWKWNVRSGLERCTNMEKGLIFHCNAVVDSKIYVLGGTKEAKDDGPVSSVHWYNTETKEWSLAGHLIYCVRSAACVAYKNCIYLFGGRNEEDNQDEGYVHVYNTADNSCRRTDKAMPKNCSRLRAVVWETSALLFEMDTCFIFN